MVRTREGSKREPTKDPEENVQPDVEVKKKKLESTSTYFNNEDELEKKGGNKSPDIKGGTSVVKSEGGSKHFKVGCTEKDNSGEQMKDSGLELDGAGGGHSDDSDGSLVFENRKRESKVKLESDTDSDESSSDEFMKVPFSLDDLEPFETVKKDADNLMPASCSASRLSESSDDEGPSQEQDYYDFSQIIQSQTLLTNMKKEQDEKANCKSKVGKLNRTKEKTQPKKSLKKTEQKTDFKSIGGKLEISDLLAMTEGLNSSGDIGDSSEGSDDGEEVKREEAEYSVPKEGVQVTIELPNASQRKKSKGVDMEAALKRRINLIRKENQVLMHKVHALCWIAHGIHLNQTINREEIMGLALSLIPSKHAYPRKDTDLSYLKALVEWFVQKIVVDEQHQLAPSSSKQISLVDVLETEINCRVAFSLRDLVLIFVCMVRSLGISARLMVSLRPVPLKPPASDLIMVSNKPTDEKSNDDSKSKKSPTLSTAKKETTKYCEESHKRNVRSVKTVSLTEGKSVNSSKPKMSEKSNLNSCKTNVKSKDSTRTSVTKSSKTESPYFSSSDELPLVGLVGKKQATASVQLEKNLNGAVKERSATSTKHKKSLSKDGDKAERNNAKTEGSPYFSSESDSKSSGHKKPSPTSTNHAMQEKGETGRATKRNKTTALATYCEVDSDTSDEEVAIPKRNTKQRKNSVTNAKGNSETQKNSRKPKIKTEEDDDIFEPPKASTWRKKPIDRRVLSSDDEDSITQKIGNDFWAEVFLELEERWISVDLKRGKVHCTQQLYNGATHPVRYVLGFNNDGTVKDVTRRYAPHWLTVTRKQRAREEWWGETLGPFRPPRCLRESLEDTDLDRHLQDKPLPTSISEYKNHPLYALPLAQV